MKRVVIAAISGIALAVTLSGCGDAAVEQFKDSPLSGHRNDAPADVVNMPDGYANVATKCDNGNRLYVTMVDSSGRAVAVVPSDPTCKGR